MVFYSLEVHLHYKRKQANDLLLIEIIIIPKLWIHRIEIPLIELEKGKIPSLKVKTELESPDNATMMQHKAKINLSWENIQHVLENILPYYKLIRCNFKSAKLLIRPWNLKSFSWHTCLGTGDAALTGIASGMLWSVKGLFWQSTTKLLNVEKNPNFEIQSNFSKRVLEVEIDGIFVCRLGNIMIGVINAWRHYRACRKGVKI